MENIELLDDMLHAHTRWFGLVYGNQAPLSSAHKFVNLAGRVLLSRFNLQANVQKAYKERMFNHLQNTGRIIQPDTEMD